MKKYFISYKNVVNHMALSRFDLLIPAETKQKIESIANDKAIAPRVLGRMLLVEKVKELKREK